MNSLNRFWKRSSSENKEDTDVKKSNGQGKDKDASQIETVYTQNVEQYSKALKTIHDLRHDTSQIVENVLTICQELEGDDHSNHGHDHITSSVDTESTEPSCERFPQSTNNDQSTFVNSAANTNTSIVLGQSKKMLNTAKVQLSLDQHTIAFTGPMKAGKSTLLNAILGRSILPSRVFAMTVLPTIIQHHPEMAENEVEIVVPCYKNLNSLLEFMQRLIAYYSEKKVKLNEAEVDNLKAGGLKTSRNQFPRSKADHSKGENVWINRMNLAVESLSSEENSLYEQIKYANTPIFSETCEREMDVRSLLERANLLYRLHFAFYPTLVAPVFSEPPKVEEVGDEKGTTSYDAASAEADLSLRQEDLNLNSVEIAKLTLDPDNDFAEPLSVFTSPKDLPRISMNVKLLDSMESIGKVSLVDTPGPDESGWSGTLSNLCRRIYRDADVTFFVLSAETFESNIDATKEAIKIVKTESNHEVNIVINKFDIVMEKVSADKLKNQVSRLLQIESFSKTSKILVVSAFHYQLFLEGSTFLNLPKQNRGELSPAYQNACGMSKLTGRNKNKIKQKNEYLKMSSNFMELLGSFLYSVCSVYLSLFKNSHKIISGVFDVVESSALDFMKSFEHDRETLIHFANTLEKQLVWIKTVFQGESEHARSSFKQKVEKFHKDSKKEAIDKAKETVKGFMRKTFEYDGEKQAPKIKKVRKTEVELTKQINSWFRHGVSEMTTAIREFEQVTLEDEAISILNLNFNEFNNELDRNCLKFLEEEESAMGAHGLKLSPREWIKQLKRELDSTCRVINQISFQSVDDLQSTENICSSYRRDCYNSFGSILVKTGVLVGLAVATEGTSLLSSFHNLQSFWDFWRNPKKVHLPKFEVKLFLIAEELCESKAKQWELDIQFVWERESEKSSSIFTNLVEQNQALCNLWRSQALSSEDRMLMKKKIQQGLNSLLHKREEFQEIGKRFLAAQNMLE